MQAVSGEQFLWTEKYRPQTVEDCILPERIKNIFLGFKESGDVPNLLLAGGAGVGKTSVAKALCAQLDRDVLVVNGSEESGIDVLRNKIRQFAANMSLVSNARKVVLLDEADYLNPQSTQPAMRGFVEEYAKSCAFVLTCNFKNRILPEIHSRCTVIDFTFTREEKKALLTAMFERLKWILEQEKIKFKPKPLLEALIKYYPDFRRTINELQCASKLTGTIDEFAVCALRNDIGVEKLCQFLKERKYQEIREWVNENCDNDPPVLFRKIFEISKEAMVEKSQPELVIMIADYLDKYTRSADRELTVLAFLCEVMLRSQWK